MAVPSVVPDPSSGTPQTGRTASRELVTMIDLTHDEEAEEAVSAPPELDPTATAAKSASPDDSPDDSAVAAVMIPWQDAGAGSAHQVHSTTAAVQQHKPSPAAHTPRLHLASHVIALSPSEPGSGQSLPPSAAKPRIEFRPLSLGFEDGATQRQAAALDSPDCCLLPAESVLSRSHHGSLGDLSEAPQQVSIYRQQHSHQLQPKILNLHGLFVCWRCRMQAQIARLGSLSPSRCTLCHAGACLPWIFGLVLPSARRETECWCCVNATGHADAEDGRLCNLRQVSIMA